MSNLDKDTLHILAEQAGLKRALEKFPDGVKAAAERGPIFRAGIAPT